MTDWTPQNNRIQTMHLTADERTALEVAIKANGGLIVSSAGVEDLGHVNPSWHPTAVYRAKPAPVTQDVVPWADNIAEMVRNNCAAMLEIIAKAKAGKLQRRAGVRRWRLELVRVGQGYAAGHKEDAEGYWVSYDDHVRAMAMVGLKAEGV